LRQSLSQKQPNQTPGRHYMGSQTSTLRTSALALVYSAAEYATTVWCRSTHARKIDTDLNGSMRIKTKCLLPSPIDLLPVFSENTPPKLRRESHTNRLAQKTTWNDQHLFYNLVTDAQHPKRQRLTSRYPFSRHASNLIKADFDLLDT